MNPIFNAVSTAKPPSSFRTQSRSIPDISEAHYELAQTYLKQADWLHAYQELAKTVEISPNNLKAQLDLADLLLAAGKIPEARNHAEIVLQSEPQNAQAQTIVSRADAAQGDLAERLE